MAVDTGRPSRPPGRHPRAVVATETATTVVVVVVPGLAATVLAGRRAGEGVVVPRQEVPTLLVAAAALGLRLPVRAASGDGQDLRPVPLAAHVVRPAQGTGAGAV